MGGEYREDINTYGYSILVGKAEEEVHVTDTGTLRIILQWLILCKVFRFELRS
jgi:hypothetical protein